MRKHYQWSKVGKGRLESGSLQIKRNGRGFEAWLDYHGVKGAEIRIGRFPKVKQAILFCETHYDGWGDDPHLVIPEF